MLLKLKHNCQLSCPPKHVSLIFAHQAWTTTVALVLIMWELFFCFNQSKPNYIDCWSIQVQWCLMYLSARVYVIHVTAPPRALDPMKKTKLSRKAWLIAIVSSPVRRTESYSDTPGVSVSVSVSVSMKMLKFLVQIISFLMFLSTTIFLLITIYKYIYCFKIIWIRLHCNAL